MQVFKFEYTSLVGTEPGDQRKLSDRPRKDSYSIGQQKRLRMEVPSYGDNAVFICVSGIGKTLDRHASILPLKLVDEFIKVFSSSADKHYEGMGFMKRSLRYYLIFSYTCASFIAFTQSAAAGAKKECMDLKELSVEMAQEKVFYHQLADIMVATADHSPEFESHTLRKFYDTPSFFRDKEGKFATLEQTACESVVLTRADGSKSTYRFEEKSATKSVLLEQGTGVVWTLKMRKIMAQQTIEEKVKHKTTMTDQCEGTPGKSESHEVFILSYTHWKKEIPAKRLVSDRLIRLFTKEVEYSLKTGRKLAGCGKPVPVEAK